MSSRRWAAGMLLVSAALLAYELLLMRLLALAYWGHFAGMVISIAMLGIACSGLFLFFMRERVPVRARSYFGVSAAVFGIAAPLAFIASQRLPFTPFLLTWSLHEYAMLAGRCMLFFVPFFCGGVAIGTPFVARVLPAGRLYFWNMLGSGLPALPLLLAMNFTHPMRLLSAVALLALAASVVAATKITTRAGCLLAGAIVASAVIASPFRYSEYKDLPKTLLLPEGKLLEERYGWDGVVQIVDSPHTRYLPGLSLNFSGAMPPSRLVFTDAGAMTLAFDPPQALAAPDFLRMTPEAFSFALTSSPRLLHLYGGTAELLRARSFGASDVQVVDDSETRVVALRTLLGDLQQLLARADARQKLEQDRSEADVIAVSLLGTHGTSTAGAASLDPSFLLTIEGCSRLFDHLSPAGHAIFSTWVENPPRSGVRLATLLTETLRRRGIEHLSQHVLAIRSWSTLSFFVARAPFPADAVSALRKFCEENSFDLVWFDGITPEDANRINVLPDEPYYAAIAALVGPQRDEFIRRSPFALAPPRDDRPFFNQYFRWAAVPQWIRTMGMSWLPFVEWGYLLHVTTLAVVTVLGVLLLIVPCIFTRARPTLRSATLFFSLGVAYMFVQIWAIYRLSQLVAHPLLAAALVLSAMLCASGAGAAVLTERRSSRAVLILLCAALIVATLLFPLVLRAFYPSGRWVRGAVGVVWLAAPAFFMGFPFPYSLGRVVTQSGVAWALALNGFGSVLGSLVATLVAVHFGFTALAIAAVALYAVIALLLRELPVANAV